MSSKAIAGALKGFQTGNGWLVCCPAHDDRNPSLSVRDGTDGGVLVHCHAGCAQRDVLAALKECGLWDGGMGNLWRHASRRKDTDAQSEKRRIDRSAAALKIWQFAIPAHNTLVETYLTARGLTLPVPPSLRFRHGLKHPTGGLWPCMVALVPSSSNCKPQAIHRTYLVRNGSGKAPVQPPKMMLGPCGGGAVRLADPTDLLMVGEGIETCLAAMQATGLPAWAALSTSGLKSLDLPSTVRDVIVLADGDHAGEAAAQHCARRWVREGRRVRIARPPRGMDFNDVLIGSESGLEVVG